MDPQATLDRIRRMIQAESPHDTRDPAYVLFELSEAVAALDEWLSRSGYLPDDWASTLDAKVDRQRSDGTDRVVPKATSRPLTTEEYLERWGD